MVNIVEASKNDEKPEEIQTYKNEEKDDIKISEEFIPIEVERQIWVDYLRVFGVFILIPYHVLCTYGLWWFNLRHDPIYVGVGYYISFQNTWHMPLLYVLAAYCIKFSIMKRKGECS